MFFLLPNFGAAIIKFLIQFAGDAPITFFYRR